MIAHDIELASNILRRKYGTKLCRGLNSFVTEAMYMIEL
jgi:hypothetical protein